MIGASNFFELAVAVTVALFRTSFPAALAKTPGVLTEVPVIRFPNHKQLQRSILTVKEMQIFEPALCCETGICGASVDPELLRITTVIDRLKQNGVIVKRFNLNSAPMEFVTNHKVNVFINQDGAEALPGVLVDGNIVIEGRYPTNEEILTLLELPSSALLPRNIGGGCGCSCQNGGCC